MFEFFQILADPNLPFLRYALLLGLVSSVSLGLVGTYVVVRRISYIAAAIAHCILAGVGAAVFFRAHFGWDWLEPGYGALLAGVLAALLIGWVSTRFRQREDSVIGAIWVIGMAIGLLFLSKTPGYFDPMAYLFGDILLVNKADLGMAAALGVFILGVLYQLHRQIIAVALDAEFAAVRGLRVEALHYLMLLLTALAIVQMVSLIGIVLVVALVSLPPAIASVVAGSVPKVVLGAVVLNAGLIFFGLWSSYTLDTPTGPTIIILAGILFVATLLGKGALARFKRA